MRTINYLFKNQTRTGTISEDLQTITHSDDAAHKAIDSGTAPVKTDEVTILTPEIPGKIVCVGRNYAAHAAELGNQIPSEPLLFLKAPSAMIFDGDDIEIPPQSEQVEYEGELGIVIGNTMKNLTDSDDPFSFVLGYICLNDVTARDLQRNDLQFTRAKSFDTFCPVSRTITRAGDVSDLQLTTRVNDVTKQSGRTSQMIFAIDYLLKYISNQMTLNFGDIIATGTPSGVSALKPGDVCEIEIEGIGKISNRVKNAR